MHFAWAATKEKTPTEDTFKRRNFDGPSRRSMCLGEEESADHLLIHCRWASSLCHLSLSLMGVRWAQPSSIKDVVVAWRRTKNNWISSVWNKIPLAILWCTWKERNSRIFEDKALSYQNYKLYFLRLLYN